MDQSRLGDLALLSGETGGETATDGASLLLLAGLPSKNTL